MATATWHAGRGGATVRVRLNADGTARASCATQDIGTGTYTIFAQVVSDKTGIVLDKIQVVLGDSTLPPGPTSGGSTVTATVLPAIAKATDQAVQRLLEAALITPGSPYFTQDRANAPKLAMTNGWVHDADKPYNSGVPFDEILIARRLAALDGEATTGPDMAAQEHYSFHSFGAQFMEVAWDPGIARLRVTRALTVIDAGKIINKKAGTNQILGAVVMGIGMAMFEEAIYDPRTGQADQQQLCGLPGGDERGRSQTGMRLRGASGLSFERIRSARHRRDWAGRRGSGADDGDPSRDRGAGAHAAVPGGGCTRERRGRRSFSCPANCCKSPYGGTAKDPRAVEARERSGRGRVRGDGGGRGGIVVPASGRADGVDSGRTARGNDQRWMPGSGSGEEGVVADGAWRGGAAIQQLFRR